MAEKKRLRFGARHIEVEDSTLINKVFYDADTKTLDAEFKKGARYRYKNVKPEVFAKFVTASSLGKFFNKNIRTKYPYQVVSS